MTHTSHVDRWRKLIEDRHDQGRRLDQQHRRPDAWQGRARRFAQFVAETGERDPLLHRLLARIQPTDTVLDVGAGPGRHAIPLARVAKHVTVVEPSAAMRDVLVQNIASSGLTNLTVLEGDWPGQVVEPADLVLCAHVLYAVAEVEPFVRALDAATRDRCCIALRLGQREGPFLDLFEQVWDEPRCLAPTAIDLFNVAHELGFAANFEVIPFPSWRFYESREDAVDIVIADLLNPSDPAAETKVRAFLDANLVQREGRIALRADEPRAGVVWWERNPATE